jgi:hypothetical protein
MRDRKLIFLFILVAILGIVYMGLTQASHASPNGIATRTLTAHGFDDIRISPTAPGYCHDSGEFAYAFTAKSREGMPVKGVVCARTTPVQRAYLIIQ